MKDLLSSIVVFLVALPLCLGVAIASGVPPAYGLITGIVGGLVVGFIAGCPLQVSGPAAGLTVIVLQLVQKHGLPMLGWVVLFAGVFQILAGLLRAGQIFRAISPAVIHGMLAGIGVLIFSSQIHVMVDDKPRGSGLQNLLSIPDAVARGILPMDSSPHFFAAMVGILTILILIAWNKFTPKAWRVVPGALVAVVIAALFANLGGLQILYVNVPSDLLGSLNILPLQEWSSVWSVEILGDAFALAFVASAETLLCATAVDQMHNGKRTNYDREMVAQGVGNSICGFLGTLPMTGVIVRSAANVNAGAVSRMSAVYHGAWLLALVAVFPQVLELVPTSALAALLVFTGFKLLNIAELKNLARYGTPVVGIYFATIITIVTVDLLSGILVGIGLSVAKVLYLLTHMEIDVLTSDDRVDLSIRGAATFLRLPKLADELAAIPQGMEVHLHLRAASYIDHACLEQISVWQSRYESTGGSVVLDWDEMMRGYHAKMRSPRRAESQKTPVVPSQSSTDSDAHQHA